MKTRKVKSGVVGEPQKPTNSGYPSVQPDGNWKHVYALAKQLTKERRKIEDDPQKDFQELDTFAAMAIRCIAYAVYPRGWKGLLETLVKEKSLDEEFEKYHKKDLEAFLKVRK